MDFHIVIEKNSGRATIIFDTEVYEKEAITAAAYGQTSNYSMQINTKEQHFEVTFTSKDPITHDNIHQDMLDFMNDALDEQLRLQLDRKTGRLREIIVEHAFKPIQKLREKISENL